MAMYFYASKLSAMACGNRCKQTVLQKARGQRDRDKCDVGNEMAEERSGSVMEIFSVPSKLNIHDFEASGSCTSLKAVQTFSLEQASVSEMNVEVRTSQKASGHDLNFESLVFSAGSTKIISGTLERLIEQLMPKNPNDFDREFVFTFLLSSRLFLRPHELLGQLLNSVPDKSSSSSSREGWQCLVQLLNVWTNKFPYDYRDERMMNHVKHIAASCAQLHHCQLEALVSHTLSALLKCLTDLEGHESDLRACQTSNNDKLVASAFDTPMTATQYAQILCRLERKLAKLIGAEEFVQCSTHLPALSQERQSSPTSCTLDESPTGAQDPKKTCNLESYLDWSARLRLHVCNEILQCEGIQQRSGAVELWSGVAQYCLLVGNYNSATAILEALESPPIARLSITWSNLQTTCQQVDCMQRHAESHGQLWQQQQEQAQSKTMALNELQQPPTEQPQAELPNQTTYTTASTHAASTTPADKEIAQDVSALTIARAAPLKTKAFAATNNSSQTATTTNSTKTIPAANSAKAKEWVVIPVFADIVQLALAERASCLQRLPNGHINMAAFERLAAIVGAYTKHMQDVEAPTSPTWNAESPSGSEFAQFSWHMQQTSMLSETELMMASFACEKPSNAEKLMYNLN